ncbi:Binding protein dependent transporter [Sodalis praecaptivus]|uniref:Binding protein dependent transporter n=1 Tax=Sodalis praecaptivus TaxID=1239307 RepID=W0HRY5_9GAMM|nr:ABC transporter permease subunit [Sodalis praecaptivus]AHF76586.1 Binding protein dependent transporter [Sodalis praecaptivus]
MRLTYSPLLMNLTGCALALLAWQLGGMGLGDALLATPGAVALSWLALLGDAVFWRALVTMLMQMLAGYLLALAVGIPLGIAMGRSRWVMAAVKPWASMFIVVSAAALVPLFILLLGRGMLMCIAIVFVATLWYVVMTMQQAARDLPARYMNVALSFGASRHQRFRLVMLPALFPYLLVAARIGLTHSLRAMVTAEMFISTDFGGLLNDAGLELSTAPLFALIVMLMLISVTATGLLRWLAGRVAPWYASRTEH